MTFDKYICWYSLSVETIMGPCYAWALVVYGGQGLHTCATTWVASRSSKIILIIDQGMDKLYWCNSLLCLAYSYSPLKLLGYQTHQDLSGVPRHSVLIRKRWSGWLWGIQMTRIVVYNWCPRHATSLEQLPLGQAYGLRSALLEIYIKGMTFNFHWICKPYLLLEGPSLLSEKQKIFPVAQGLEAMAAFPYLLPNIICGQFLPCPLKNVFLVPWYIFQVTSTFVWLKAFEKYKCSCLEDMNTPLLPSHVPWKLSLQPHFLPLTISVRYF